jgi:transmembrane sensor
MSNHSDTQPTHGAVLAFPEHKTIQTQASEWLAKLDAEQPSPQDLAAFKQWVNAHPAHRIAFEEMVEFWDDMNILTQAVLPRELMAPPTKMRRRFAPVQAAMGAAVLAIVGLVSILGLPLSTTVYTTGVGEQKTLQLADNSMVQLNTNSRLEVDYSGDSRRLTLTQGEAHFDVAHNPQRPFEVLAGQGLVRAIGTAFTVHIRKIDVEVIVTEGTVELAPAPTPQVTAKPITEPATAPSGNTQPQPTGTLKATAGSMLTFDKNLLSDVEQMVASQLQKQLSWREGMLVFKAEPLQSVVDEVSRYTNLKIIIPERSAREMKVGGLFKVGDTESLFEALREGFDIHVKEVSSDVVYLISSEQQ